MSRRFPKLDMHIKFLISRDVRKILLTEDLCQYSSLASNDVISCQRLYFHFA